MPSSARAAPGHEDDSAKKKYLTIAAIAVVVVASGGWYLYQAGRTARLANRTIALQERLLGKGGDPADRRRAVDEIMRNVDRLPPTEIRRVRDALFKRISSLRQESLGRFVDATPEERTMLLDEDLDRIKLVRGIMDATDQGGMRPYTEAELVERQRQRQEREERAKQAAATTTKPKTPRPPTDEQKQAIEYIDALTKRAKEKNVDLGRMFSRPPGRG